MTNFNAEVDDFDFDLDMFEVEDDAIQTKTKEAH